MMTNIDLNEFRKKYPAYKNWSDKRLSNAINLKHQKEGIHKSERGWAGIGSDIQESFSKLPETAANLVKSIPEGARNVGKYAFSHNPVETLGNIGAGGVESMAGLLSAPEQVMKYLGNKFPSLDERINQNRKQRTGSDESKTIYEQLMDFEKEKGLVARSEEESSVRNLGGLLFGGKGLSKLKSPVAGTMAISGETAGRGGDPLHAALLGALGHGIAKAPWKEGPTSVKEAIKNTPEMLGQGAASVLGTAADIGTKFHVPGVQPTLGALSSYLKHKSVSPEKFATKQLFGDIKGSDLPMIEERLKAAKRLGLDYLTPAEATLSPFEAAKQGKIGRTSAGSKLLFEKGKQRTKSEETAISNLLDMIHTEKLAPEMEQAYKETMSKNVPQEFITRNSNDPLIESAEKELKNNPAYKKALGNVPRNSFEYWDHVKRILGDMEEKEAGRKPYLATVIGDTRKKMVAEMDKVEPQYKKARNISERDFTRRELESFFDKRKMTGNNFYKYLESKKKFDKLFDKLSPFPKAQKHLKDMKLLFGDLIPNDMSIRAATQQKRTGMSDRRNKLDALKDALDEKYGQEHDVSTVNMMTNPMLLDLIKKHLSK